METLLKNKFKHLLLVFLLTVLVALLLTGCGPSGPTETVWELVWQDEFEGLENQVIDSSKWVYDLGTDWGNAQLEYDTDRPENVSLDGEGNLVITAQKESYEGRAYTSARILTRGKYETAYGKFEARIQLPWGYGIWPAFWLLGSNFETVGWPECGEIDIMEYRGQEVTKVLGTIHGPSYSGAFGVGAEYNIVRDRFDTGFHIFTLEWAEDYIRWYVDNDLFLTVRHEDVSGDWVFDHPFYIILNVAVGGGFVGSPTSSTVFPQKMLVDYIRVYKESL